MTFWTFNVDDVNTLKAQKPLSTEGTSEQELKNNNVFKNLNEFKSSLQNPNITGRIFLADNIVDYNLQQILYTVCCKSNYFLGWEDRTDENKTIKNLHSTISKEQLQTVGLFSKIETAFKNSIFKDDYDNLMFSKSVINLTKAGDVHFAHTHPGQVICLYYVNLEWKEGFYGETVFYDNNVQDIKFSSNFKPGRFVIFDGELPHSIRPQSSIGPTYRFTISTFFQKSENIKV